MIVIRYQLSRLQKTYSVVCYIIGESKPEVLANTYSQGLHSALEVTLVTPQPPAYIDKGFHKPCSQVERQSLIWSLFSFSTSYEIIQRHASNRGIGPSQLHL